MAKYTVTRACGHEETVILFGKTKDREWRLEKVEPEKLCYGCYQKELADQREKENREAAEAARENNLPVLSGTEKQVVWAETLRIKMLAEMEIAVYKRVLEEKRGMFFKTIELIKNTKTEAKWWIDHRMIVEDRVGMIELLLKVSETTRFDFPVPEEIKRDAAIEATVRPETPKTETVAEIRALENAIEIEFPEKRDDFWQIVKKQLHMEWSGKCWRRKLIAKNGTPQDRAAEAGHRILAAGFSIRIYDEKIRRGAMAGDYAEECSRWVQKRTKGEYTGWFVVSWDRQNEDFYTVARRLPGSKWSNPYVVVPAEQFEEVIDFAQMYGFKLSSGAQELAEAARNTKENALIAKVAPPTKRSKTVISSKPQALEIPVEVGIADEFKDGVNAPSN